MNIFSHCNFCALKHQNIKILDYDAFIPLESNIAFAVYFRLPSQNQTERRKSKSPSGKRRGKK